ncbi:MAG: DUF748 domain-containing protein [Candidatus Omnitrophica bacterium]|nr:DUF748 domain-containing protein [Candidatus Omnitrophota bacterium]
MKKINKVLIIILVVFFSIFILANIAVSVFAKKIVVEQLEQNLKVKASLGSINISLPFSVNLNNLEIKDLVKINRLSVSPNIFAIFAGKIVLGSVVLVDPLVTLTQGPDGRLNLPQLEQKGVKPPEVYVTSLAIRNGKVIFNDKKASPEGFKVILERINVDISKVMFPPTSLKANFKASANFMNSSDKKIGNLLFSGWIDFGPKDMVANLNLKDLDIPYFEPYYGNFISNKKLLAAKLNIGSTFRAKDNDLNIQTNFKLSDIVYAQEEPTEQGTKPQLDLVKNTLDFFTDEKGNLNLDFEVKTKLDKPNITVSQLQKMIFKAAAKNIVNQSPESLIKKVNDNIDQFKEFGKSLEDIFKKKK